MCHYEPRALFPGCGNLLRANREIASAEKLLRDDMRLNFLVMPPPRDALLKEKASQHPECQRLYHWCIEGCGLTEKQLLNLADFLGRDRGILGTISYQKCRV